MSSVQSLVDDKAVVIFSKSTCGICHTVKSLIRGFGANPTVYELDELPNGSQIERELLASRRKPGVPAVFIGQKMVGGADEIMSLQVRGELSPLLIKAKAIWI